MKKIIILISLVLINFVVLSQNDYKNEILLTPISSLTNYKVTVPSNDLISNASPISGCAINFNTSNYGATAATNACNLTDDAQGPFAAVYGDLDCNNATGNQCTGGPCPAYAGGDVNYSVENDIWYKFCPTVAGIYTLAIASSSCTTASGFQATAFQGTSTSLSINLGGGSAANNATLTLNLNITSTTSCVFIEIDGYAGTQCNFAVKLNACVSCCSALPIELISFQGFNDKNSNILFWKTASELNNKGFNLQRSEDGVNWKNITFVEGHNTSYNVNSYSYIDISYKPIINYYRLEQVDYNGMAEVLGLVDINNAKEIDQKFIKKTNILGQEVTDEYRGTVILYTPDGFYKIILQ